jgi:hypothetical protein
MADLEVKRDAVRTKLAEDSKASGDAWKDVQKGVKSAWEDVGKALPGRVARVLINQSLQYQL